MNDAAKSGVEASVKIVAAAWKESPYYAEAEKWNHIFWGQGAIFRKLFEKLNLMSVIELACGHGRHAEKIARQCGTLTLIDVHKENIDRCRERLAVFNNVSYVVNSGHTFDNIRENSITSIFCYDAMVHFSPDIVEAYLKDTHRVLVSGGRALYHHSNYDAPPDRHYGQNPHARNRMTFEMLNQFAKDAGLKVEESHALSWGGVGNLDRVTLFRKP